MEEWMQIGQTFPFGLVYEKSIDWRISFVYELGSPIKAHFETA